MKMNGKVSIKLILGNSEWSILVFAYAYSILNSIRKNKLHFMSTYYVSNTVLVKALPVIKNNKEYSLHM